MSKITGYKNSKGFIESDGTPFEITTDENGVLKIGDIIIPQRKVLWEGEANANSDTAETTITLSSEIADGDILEIKAGFGIGTQTFKFKASNVGSSTHFQIGLQHVYFYDSEGDQPLLYHRCSYVYAPSSTTLKVKAPYIWCFKIPPSPDNILGTVVEDGYVRLNASIARKGSITIYSVTKIIE